MPHLEIRLLGRLEVRRDGSEVTRLGSDTARALLALLASEPGRPWSRASIAELLWPDRPPGGALGNLRHTLSVLRGALEDSTALVTDRTTIALASSEDIWVDLAEFEDLAEAPLDAAGALSAWQRATELWRGEFLEGLQPAASAEWEDWKRVTGERCRRRLADTLRNIADYHDRAGDLDKVIDRARRLIEIDAWDERAHRQLMQALAGRGDGALALAHYSDLVKRFEDDYGAAPSPLTTALAESIRSGGASEIRPVVAVLPTEWLSDTPTEAAEFGFVGRESELGALQSHLASVRSGPGRLILVAGEAGSGKTTLITEFMRCADVRTVGGRCNALAGLGDPYLPFREALSLLAGDVATRLKTGALTTEQATRLWAGMPHVARMIDEHGPHLLGVMIDGVGLVERAATAAAEASWFRSLRRRVEATTRGGATNRIQPALFDEYTTVLARTAEESPLVMVIDDLQWADAGSVALLWHLVRRLDQLRVLVIGVYRPEDMTNDDAEASASASMMHELTVRADHTIELSADRHFVDALVDAAPNELDDDFRTKLFSFTGGHALFTVEMLRGMRENGQIARNTARAWVQQDSLAWTGVPRRIEAAIGRRLSRLSGAVRADLAAASIQGDEFIAEVVAAARGGPAALGRLRDHAKSDVRVIQSAGVERIGGNLATRYRFRHDLFRQYLSRSLDPAEHVRLHEATAHALEELHASHPDPPVVDLAFHFEEAQMVEPAIQYLDQAAHRARAMAANDEAIGLLSRAHRLLQQLPTSAARNEREMELLVLLAAPINAARGWGTPEARRISDRIQQLIEHAKPSVASTMALIRLAGTYKVAGRFDRADQWNKEAVTFADTVGNPTLSSVAAVDAGHTLLELGKLEEAHALFVPAYTALDSPDADVISTYGFDPLPGSLAFDARAVWAMGYPDQGHALMERALEAARACDHPFTLCLVLGASTQMQREFGRPEAVVEALEELERILADYDFPFWRARALDFQGQVAAGRGDLEGAVGLMQDALAEFRAMGIRAWTGELFAHLVEVEHQRGNSDRALQILTEGEQEIDRYGAPLAALHLSVQRGAVLRRMGDETAREALLDALSAADSLGDRCSALETATELALLSEAEGRDAEAVDVLAPRYEWFTSGFNTPLLVAAREVLGRL